MRKVIGTAAALMLIAASFGGAASAAPKQQTVEGSVAMMAPFPADLTSCYSGLHRRLAVVTQEQVNGVVGFHFDVDPATAKKPFKLEVTGGQGAVDLDISFYTEFGTVEQATDTAYAPANVAFEEREPGGEAGIVPEGMTKAIVCMYDGQASTFTYTAGKGVK